METVTSSEQTEKKTDDAEDAEDDEATETKDAKHPLGSTFGKPGEIVAEVVSGMEKVAAVSGHDRTVPRAVVKRSQDLDTPKPKKSARVTESPTSTGQVRVSPAFGADGPRVHKD